MGPEPYMFSKLMNPRRCIGSRLKIHTSPSPEWLSSTQLLAMYIEVVEVTLILSSGKVRRNCNVGVDIVGTVDGSVLVFETVRGPKESASRGFLVIAAVIFLRTPRI